MLKLWGRKESPNVMRVLWMLAEIDVPYERIEAGGPHGGLDAPAFRAMNPNGLIPVIEDGGAVIWETNAILRYLAARYPRQTLWPRRPDDRALAEMWMDWSTTELGAALRTAFYHIVKLPPEERDPEARDAAAETLDAAFRLLDAHLATTGGHVGGPYLTVGDIPAAVACHFWQAIGLAGDMQKRLPALHDWYGRLSARAGFRDHVAAVLPLPAAA